MQQKISQNISRFRQNQTMTQEEFAARLGVTPQAVSKWERGASIPDITLIPNICKLLKVHADMLLGIDMLSLSENKSMAEEREIKQNLIAEPLRIEVGLGLISCISQGLETDYVHQCRCHMIRFCCKKHILISVCRPTMQSLTRRSGCAEKIMTAF